MSSHEDNILAERHPSETPCCPALLVLWGSHNDDNDVVAPTYERALFCLVLLVAPREETCCGWQRKRDWLSSYSSVCALMNTRWCLYYKLKAALSSPTDELVG